MAESDAGRALDRLLTGRVCFDATVPLYLAEAGCAATLAGAFRDRAYIPRGVFQELDGLSHHGHPACETLLRPRPFARVITLTDDELAAVVKRQRRWNGERVFDDPTEDRGEAECLELCLRGGDMALCAQDGKAIRDGRAAEISLFNSGDVSLVFALRGTTVNRAWELYTELVRLGMFPVRRLPPDHVGKATFETMVVKAKRLLDARMPA